MEIVGEWADLDCDQPEEMVEEECSSLDLILYDLKGALNKRKDLYKSEDLTSLKHEMDQYASAIFRKTKKMKSLINALKTREEVNPVVMFKLLQKEKQFLRAFKRVMNKADRECKDSVQRWGFILTGKQISDDIVESIISTGNYEALVKVAVESGKESISMETLAREVDEQQGQMERLRISLVDLRMLFQQMQSLVQAEVEHINDVERYLNSTSSRVRTGSNRLNTARNYNKWNKHLRIVGLGMIVVLGFFLGVGCAEKPRDKKVVIEASSWKWLWEERIAYPPTWSENLETLQKFSSSLIAGLNVQFLLHKILFASLLDKTSLFSSGITLPQLF